MHTATLRSLTLISLGLAVSLGYPHQALAEIELPELSQELRQIFDGQTPRDIEQLRQMERYQQELARKVIASVVSVQVGPAHGSGVIVTPMGHVLTAGARRGPSRTPRVAGDRGWAPGSGSVVGHAHGV